MVQLGVRVEAASCFFACGSVGRVKEEHIIFIVSDLSRVRSERVTTPLVNHAPKTYTIDQPVPYYSQQFEDVQQL